MEKNAGTVTVTTGKVLKKLLHVPADTLTSAGVLWFYVVFERNKYLIWFYITYYLLTESEVITGKFQTEVWDFSVMTEWTRLISYLLYGLFSAINITKTPIKTLEVIFRLRTLRLSSSLILKKYLYASFLSVIENIVVLCPSFHFSCFLPSACSLTHNSKDPSSREKIS